MFRSSVTKLEYVDTETLLSGSEDGTMRVWSVATGTQKEEVDGGSLAFSKDSSSEQKVGLVNRRPKEGQYPTACDVPGVFNSKGSTTNTTTIKNILFFS